MVPPPCNIYSLWAVEILLLQSPCKLEIEELAVSEIFSLATEMKLLFHIRVALRYTVFLRDPLVGHSWFF
jgi:hypothetical protein